MLSGWNASKPVHFTPAIRHNLETLRSFVHPRPRSRSRLTWQKYFHQQISQLQNSYANGGEHEEDCIYARVGGVDVRWQRNSNISRGRPVSFPDDQFPERHVHSAA